MKFCSENDIKLCIQIIQRAQEKTKGTNVYEIINAPCNRVIFELEELLKQDKKDKLEDLNRKLNEGDQK